jgi:hypothetical protein
MKAWQWGALLFALAIVALDLGILVVCILFPGTWLA